MTNRSLQDQVSTPVRDSPVPGAPGRRLVAAGDHAGRDQRQVISNLGKPSPAAQLHRDMGDRRQPTLNEDLRRGRQEVLDLGRELADLSRDFQVLLNQEMQLARAEMQQQLRLSSRAFTWGGIALVLLFLTLVFVSLGGMFALALVQPLWVSALITAGALLVLGAGAGLIALQRFRQVRLMPQRAMESVKEDIRWINSQLRSNAKSSSRGGV